MGNRRKPAKSPRPLRERDGEVEELRDRTQSNRVLYSSLNSLSIPFFPSTSIQIQETVLSRIAAQK